MIAYSVISIICLVLMLGGSAWILSQIFRKGRAERISYVRGFKRGKGVLIYLVSQPLYWMGIVYSGENVLNGFFLAIRRIVDLVVLKYDTGSVIKLINDNIIYAVTLYLSFVLVAVNAIMLAWSIANQGLWNRFTSFLFHRSPSERLVIFGNNPSSREIYESDSERAKIIVDKISGKRALKLYMQNIVYISTDSPRDYARKTVIETVKRNVRSVIIINTENEEGNIELARAFVKSLKELDEASRAACFGLVSVFVFGDPRYEAIYEEITSSGYGCISYINKYQKIAMDFIDRYPISSFMTEEHIHYESSLVREGVDINTFFIGFGKTNQQIFLTSVANNQFIERKDGKIVLKKVKYYIFDKENAENDKNLNHNYNRYKNECKDGNYLPPPDYPAEEHFLKLDVNDPEFYNQIRTVSGERKNSVNFIVIAFGTDLENIDMAQKLISKFKEWGIDNVSIFVKVRAVGEGESLLRERNCYVIGNERLAVYNIDKILGDSIFHMAQMRNEVYDIEYELTHSDKAVTSERIKEIKENARRGWYMKKSQLERDSSLYCCLSLRSKLNMMALDYCPKTDPRPAISESGYMEIYARADKPDTEFYGITAEGKPIVHYTLDFADSRRTNLAIQEHLRWNSFMISRGVIPATLEQIRYELKPDGKTHTNGKNYAVRRHGNITTFEGLVDFRRMLAERDGKPEENYDVIKYDYQILDDAFWLLDKNGYKIVEKLG